MARGTEGHGVGGGTAGCELCCVILDRWPDLAELDPTPKRETAVGGRGKAGAEDRALCQAPGSSGGFYHQTLPLAKLKAREKESSGIGLACQSNQGPNESHPHRAYIRAKGRA